jgi:hypothetical protein
LPEQEKMINRNTDQGFTLPSALGMGFILMMLTAALLQQAHSAQITAGMQARSELSTAIAEAGVARVQSFFERQRSLITHDAKEWSALLQNFEQCSDAATANHYAQGDWLDLPQGRFRVRSYTFTAKSLANGQIGVGKLLIEGQTTTFNQATSVIAVEIPVSVNDTKLPVLWTTMLETNKHQKITGNVRVHQCPDSSDHDGVAGINANQISQPEGKPSGQILAAPLPLPQARSAPDHAINLPPINDALTLPQPGDLPDEHGQYHYQIASDLYGTAINLPSGKTIKVNLAEKQSVNFYLRGNARIGGDIVAIDSNKNTVPQSLRIYGGVDTTKFSIGDQSNINSMIHAPEAIGYSYRETGKSSSATTNILTGILWLKTWNGSDSQLSIIQAGTWVDLQIPPAEKLGVRIHPLSSWQRQAKS